MRISKLSDIEGEKKHVGEKTPTKKKKRARNKFYIKEISFVS